MTTLTWLHLSDWHQRGAEYDRQVVLEALINDLKDRIKFGPGLAKMDFVIFSGDIAFAGKPAEYAKARGVLFERVLAAVDVKPEKLFVVPGNHDLDRERLKFVSPELQQPLASHEQIVSWLEAPVDKEDHLQNVLLPFRAYKEFIDGYTKQKSPDYASTQIWTIGGKEVALLGLNSAWMCARRKDEHGEVDEYGYITVGEPQIQRALGEISSADIRIAVLHHPFEWLAEFDRNRVHSRLERECHFILHGHQHHPQVQVVRGTSGDCVVIPAGASYNRRIAHDPRYDNAYNFVQVDLDSHEGMVYLRRWDETNNRWVEDVRTHDKGKYRFSMPDSTKADNGSITSSCVPIKYRYEGPPDLQHPFVRKLVEADEVSIIALTHENSVLWLESALRLRNGRFWQRLQVIIPTAAVLDGLPPEVERTEDERNVLGTRTIEERKRKWDDGRKAVFTFLLRQPPDRWEYLEYAGHLPFTGPWFKHNAQPSSMWVQLLLPGRDIKQIFRAEFFEGEPAYDQLTHAYTYICTKSSSITEWDIYGTISAPEQFCYRGIVNCKRLSTKHTFYFPTVLVILHAYTQEEGDNAPKHRVLLQGRTIYNAAADPGKFSNISGYVTNADLFRARGKDPIACPDDKDANEAARELEEKVGLTPGEALPDQTWQQAAIREIREELGISVSPGINRLDKVWKSIRLDIPRPDGKLRHLFFRIFSLRLSRGGVIDEPDRAEMFEGGGIDEVEAIKEARPEANLHPLGLSELRKLKDESKLKNELKEEGKLNHLLDKHFDDFVEIFKELGIDD